MLNMAALPLYTFCEVKLNMWSWNQCVLMVSRQSPGILVRPPLPLGVLALLSVAPVLKLVKPPSLIGQ